MVPSSHTALLLTPYPLLPPAGNAYMTPREELLQIQRRMVRDLKREIYDSLYGDSVHLKEYSDSYDKHFNAAGNIVTRDELIDRLFDSDIVYHGDFHTLKLAQVSPIKILRELQRRGRRVCLALEMFCAGDQEIIDRFRRMEIGEDRFLESIRYDTCWGFDWQQYRALIYFALSRGIPILAIDCRDYCDHVPLDIRDLFAAERIVARREEHPDELIYVFAGELHIAPDHLPAAVDRVSGDDAPSRTILYQNNERVYWQLADRGEQDAGLVRLDEDQFCLMNSTPLMVYQSFQHWAEQQEELAQVEEGWWDDGGNSIDYTEQVHQLVRCIAEFLDLWSTDLDNFTVYSSHDLDFLDVAAERYEMSEDRVRGLMDDIAGSKSLIVPEARLIYLSSTSMNRAAEESARHVHFLAAGYSGPPTDVRDRFYAEVMHEALGFFGSKVINHKRTAKPESYYRKIHARSLKRNASAKEAGFLRVARFALRHWKLERRRFGGDTSAKWPDRCYDLETRLRRGVTGALGHLLGEELYAALIDGWLSKEEVRALFLTAYDEPRRGYETYFCLRAQLADAAAARRAAVPLRRHPSHLRTNRN